MTINNDLKEYDNYSEQEISFDDLQPLFDDQSDRLAALLNRSEAQQATIGIARTVSLRRKILMAWCLLAIIFVALAIYWGVALWLYKQDIYYNLFTLLLEGFFILLGIESVVNIVSLLRHNPVHTSFDGMLHYSRSRKMGSNPQYIIGNIKQTATAGIAASFMFIMVSCSTTVGDGYTITQEHNTRIETIDNIHNTLISLNKR